MRDEGISNAGFAAALAVVDCGMMNQQTEKDVMLEIANKHQEAGHPGVPTTLYFARRDITRSIT